VTSMATNDHSVCSDPFVLKP